MTVVTDGMTAMIAGMAMFKWTVITDCFKQRLPSGRWEPELDVCLNCFNKISILVV
jgi:hypothetical protein